MACSSIGLEGILRFTLSPRSSLEKMHAFIYNCANFAALGFVLGFNFFSYLFPKMRGRFKSASRHISRRKMILAFPRWHPCRLLKVLFSLASDGRQSLEKRKPLIAQKQSEAAARHMQEVKGPDIVLT